MSKWMTELRQLRREMQADFETTWDLQAATNKRLEALADEVQILARQVELQARQVERHSREFVDVNRTLTGRMRLQEQRVGRFFEVVEKELESHDDRLRKLEEQQRPPAA